MDDWTMFLWLKAGDRMDELEALAKANVTDCPDSCLDVDQQEEEADYLIEQLLSDEYREDYHMVDSL